MKIKYIRINRMPGFPTGLKGFEKTAKHINIVTGRNGAGKSSSARLIQKLIWWDKSYGFEVDAQIDVRNQLNDIHINSLSYNRKSGALATQEDFSQISPAEFKDKYMLALHDMINDNDNNLAAEIVRQVNGGINLKDAKDKLGYKDSIRNTGTKEYTDYQAAQKKYQNLLSEHKNLRTEEDKLTQLEANKLEADRAWLYKDFYEKLLNYFQARDEFIELEQHLAQFPPNMEKLKDDDYSTARDTDEKLKKAEEAVADNLRVYQKKMSELQQMNSSAEVTQEVLQEISNRLSELKQLEQEIDQAKREIAKVKITINNTGAFIDSEESSTSLKNLNLEEVYELSEFVRTANEVEGSYNLLVKEKLHIEKEITRLTESQPKSVGTVDNLHRGIIILSDWLKGVSTPDNHVKKIIWALPLLGAICILLGYFGELIGFIIGISVSIILFPVLIMWLNNLKKRHIDELKIRISDYEKLQISIPDEWTSQQVTELITQLLSSYNQLKLIEKLDEKLKLIHDELTNIQKDITNVQLKYQEYRHNIGVLPADFNRLTSDFNAFYYFLSQIIKWQEATLELGRQEASVTMLQDKFNNCLIQLNDIFSYHGYPPVKDINQADARAGIIATERESRRDLINNLEKLHDTIDIQKQYINEYSSRIQEIYQHLGMASEDLNNLKQLNDNLKDYTKLRKEVENRKLNVSLNLTSLQRHSYYSELKDQIKHLDIETVKTRIKDYAVMADRREAIISQIAKITTEIDNKIRHNDMELALTDKEEKLNCLYVLFENNLRSVTGNLIVQKLNDEISLNNDNKVFKKANKILGSITNNKYSLKLSEELSNSFYAYDLNRQLTQPLEELSTGTKVQLLLAIRLAYIETQESTVKLPILADELLANSDDERSDAIIQSLIEISRNRQIFYFTAQTDEVDRWKQHLDNLPDISSAIINLGDPIVQYNDSSIRMNPVVLKYNVPLPATDDHHIYGLQLDIKPYNIMEQQPTELHLWYLIDDVHVLRRCLSKGLRQWGQLHNYLAFDGKIEGIDTELHDIIQNKVYVLEKFKKLYSVGRPRKISREILDKQKFITGSNLAILHDLLEECDHNPEALMEKLNSRRLKTIRRSTIEKFEHYLLENDFISNRDPYSDDDLLLRLKAQISELNIADAEAENFINSIINGVKPC